ncbi:MAG: hypothetical protein KAJ21_03905 [Thermoplasmatales archaeon]|nr:hypothetical protein [Thermoplasmatales archaeon]
MQIFKIRGSNEAVVGIVTAVLFLGLLVSVLALIQTVYVPRWMEQKEADHMEIVRDQFSQLKFAIDIQLANEQPYTPIATSITLGSKELPFFMSQRSYGSLEITSNEFTVEITDETGYNWSKPLGTIKYTSSNAYFLDQSFIYECGSVITSQSDGNSISIKPVFIPVNEITKVNIFFTLVNISGVGHKTGYGGFDSTAIQTEYCNCTPKTEIINNSRFINISTAYAKSWSDFVNSSLKKELTYNVDFMLYVTDDKLSIEFINDYPDVHLELKTIYTQIGPGWIE